MEEKVDLYQSAKDQVTKPEPKAQEEIPWWKVPPVEEKPNKEAYQALPDLDQDETSFFQKIKNKLAPYGGLIIILVLICLIFLIFRLFFGGSKKGSRFPTFSIFREKSSKTLISSQSNLGVVRSRNFTFDIGAADLQIGEADNENFFELNSNYYENFGEPKLFTSNERGDLYLKLEAKAKKGLTWPIYEFVKRKPFYSASLGQLKIPTDISLSLDVGSLAANFQKLLVKNVNLDLIIGNANLSFLGESTPSGEMNIDIGVGLTTIYLPKEAGLAIDHEIWLGNLTVDSEKIYDFGSYKTTNYEEAPFKIPMKVKVGEGSVKIVRM